MMTITTRSSRRVNPAARDPWLLGLALSEPSSTDMLIDTAPIFATLYAVIPSCEGRRTPYDLAWGRPALPRSVSALESSPRNRINYVQAAPWRKPIDPVYCLQTGG